MAGALLTKTADDILDHCNQVKEHRLRATRYLICSVEALGEELVSLVSRYLARRVVSSDE